MGGAGLELCGINAINPHKFGFIQLYHTYFQIDKSEMFGYNFYRMLYVFI